MIGVGSKLREAKSSSWEFLNTRREGALLIALGSHFDEVKDAVHTGSRFDEVTGAEHTLLGGTREHSFR